MVDFFSNRQIAWGFFLISIGISLLFIVLLAFLLLTKRDHQFQKMVGMLGAVVLFISTSIAAFTYADSGRNQPALDGPVEEIITGSPARPGLTHEQEEIRNTIKAAIILEDYNRAIELAEGHDLLETEEMLNVQGVMYANGYCFGQDAERALLYFKAAAVHGKTPESFTNLLLLSYLMDRNQDAVERYYRHTEKAVSMAHEHNDEAVNNILRTAIVMHHKKTVRDGYGYIENLSAQEFIAFFDQWDVTVSNIGSVFCSDYKYYISTSTGEETAVPYRFGEITAPISLILPDIEFCLFDDILIRPASTIDQRETITYYEYLPHYTGTDGKTYLWEDTDHYYYGDTPPEDTPGRRWVICSRDESRPGVRRYREQIQSAPGQ